MAEQRLLKLTIARVDGPVFDGEVISVAVPGAAGDMELLAGHEAIISPLRTGEVRIKKADGATENFPLSFGTLEVSHNHATILI
ncbi:MAG: H(+)-transporting two-sector ATPase synthase, epsilon subunit [Candidatus Parcubacteria bacterium]|jgi:F-type H+-transporting ATPase subunit epsilon